MSATIRRKPPVQLEHLRWCTDTLAWTLGIRVDWAQLSDAEVRELVDLVDSARIDNGLDWELLSDRDRQKLERLAARGAGLSDRHFQTQRTEAAKIEREADTRRLPLDRKQVSNIFQQLAVALDDEELWIDDLSVLAVVLTQFASGKVMLPSNRFEGSGRDLVLIVDTNLGLFAGRLDQADTLIGWKGRLAQLGEDGWLNIDRRGPIWHVRLGPALLEAIEPASIAAELS